MKLKIIKKKRKCSTNIPEKLIKGVEKVKDVENNLCKTAEKIKQCCLSIEYIDDGLELTQRN